MSLRELLARARGALGRGRRDGDLARELGFHHPTRAADRSGERGARGIVDGLLLSRECQFRRDVKVVHEPHIGPRRVHGIHERAAIRGHADAANFFEGKRGDSFHFPAVDRYQQNLRFGQRFPERQGQASIRRGLSFDRIDCAPIGGPCEWYRGKRRGLVHQRLIPILGPRRLRNCRSNRSRTALAGFRRWHSQSTPVACRPG